MATTIVETGADFLPENLKLGLLRTTGSMIAFLSIFLFLQIWAKKYVPWLYWLTVILISVVGTLITDNLVDR